MFEFKLPDLGEGVAEGEVLEWHVAPGDRVSEDDLLAEVETDKAAVDVPSPVDGVVRELRADPGDVVAVGEVIVTIDEDGDGEAESTEPAPEPDSGTASTDGETSGRVFAAPSVRRLARESDVDITDVEGTGPGGRITEADVEAAADASDSGVESAVSRVSDEDEAVKSAVSRVSDDADAEAADGTAVKSAVRRVSADEAAPRGGERRERTLATPATRRLARELGVDIDSVPTDQTRDGEPYVDQATVQAYAEARSTEADATDAAAETTPSGAKPERREPYRGVRRTIGEQMARSRREVPHATHHDRVEVSALVEARERLEPLAEERDVDLTYTPFVLKCVAAALEQHPVLNTELDTDAEEVVYKDYYDIGVATATDHGLMVPVVENVDGKGLLALASDVNDLTARARSRDIERSEMQGGTFTVTNFGTLGGEYADPVINVPETAILGVGALKERPVVEDGEVVARPTLPLSLAIDHRVVDGADAARFVNTLKTYLADPTRLLLE
ncbi:2-oxo acid dehydrogenase subunit E2 [Halomicroarcula sp. GCM10025324]|uniref:2-oxo acid dehydrogenase subunit E2 n=1 Tax=Haloarcula TaxID=2237 RepID=UPI0023E769C2|nr:2-oxo acid dehydrogenase subunit E2 [Halomicroarcula sp. ZS-22-S1]